MMKIHAVFFALALLFGTQRAAAGPNPLYGTEVFLKNSGDHVYEGQANAVGNWTTSVNGSTLTTHGLASFGDSEASVSSAFTVSSAYTEGWAWALVSDTLTFHVANGNSAQVPVRMAGLWNAQGAGGKVSYDLYLGSTHYSGYATATRLTESFVDGAPIAAAFSFGPGDYLTGISGNYEVAALWNVVDGAVYSLSTVVRADAGGGNVNAFIDDPLTIALPPGVTFTAASNSTYAIAAVPEPSTWLLLSAGLLGFGRLGRVRRRTVQEQALRHA